MLFALSALLLAAGLVLSPQSAAADDLPSSDAANPSRPNIVLVIGDDHGWPYYGFMDSPQRVSTAQGEIAVRTIAPTPNLDALAARGVVFTRGYSTASLCVPSQRSLLSASGLHSVQWEDRARRLAQVRQLGTGGRASPSRFFRTMPRELQRHGYLTWKGGKMWEGYLANAGFTHGMEGNFGSAQLFGREKWDTAVCGSTADDATPCPALEPLRRFLDEAGDRPFFAWVAPLLPHAPYNAPPEYREPFEAMRLNPGAIRHLSNIRWFDEFFGEVLRELHRRNLTENTLVIYLSDNGWGIDFQVLTRQGRGKGTAYDLGYRTPIIFAGPGVAGPAQYDDLVLSSDVVATILDIVPGARPPRDSVGRSLRRRIAGGPPAPRERIILHHNGVSVVDRSWRYIRHADGRESLHRIDEDPFELEDVAARFPERVREMRELAAADLEQLLHPTESDVVGRVLDAQGSAVAGAQLRYGEGRDAQIVSTDAEGYFVLEPPHREGATLGSGSQLASIYWNGRPHIPELSRTAGVILDIIAMPRHPLPDLPIGGRIVIEVVDSRSGAPIAGAIVRARARTPFVSLRTFTDSTGIARFEGLPVGRYRLTVKSTGHRHVDRGDLVVATADDVVNITTAARPRRTRLAVR